MSTEAESKNIASIEKFDYSLLPEAGMKSPITLREAMEDLGRDAFGDEDEFYMWIRPGNLKEFIPFQKYVNNTKISTTIFIRDLELNKYGLDHRKDVVIKEIKKQ